MRGEFIGVWSETWREIWLPLIDEPLGTNEEGVPGDIFCELYRELAKALKAQPSIEALAEIIDDPVQSRESFEKTATADLASERAVLTFLEATHPALDDLGGDELSNRYFNLLEGAGQIPATEKRTGPGRPAIDQKGPAEFGKIPVLFGRGFPLPGNGGGYDKSLAGIPDGRLEQLGKGQPPETLGQDRPCRHRTGNRYRVPSQFRLGFI